MESFKEELQDRLHRDRYQAFSEKRDWDVADVMDIVMTLLKERNVKLP